jgi:hypothetical protein
MNTILFSTSATLRGRLISCCADLRAILRRSRVEATGRKDPSTNPTGAMFHQIEEETGWKYRTGELPGA